MGVRCIRLCARTSLHKDGIDVLEDVTSEIHSLLDTLNHIFLVTKPRFLTLDG